MMQTILMGVARQQGTTAAILIRGKEDSGVIVLMGAGKRATFHCVILLVGTVSAYDISHFLPVCAGLYCTV